MKTKRYWAGGFLWGGTNSKLDEFLNSNLWQIGYSKDTDRKGGKKFWEMLNEIVPGDEFAIKGMGGKHDLKIHYIGEVVEVDSNLGIIRMQQLDRPLYKGKGPKGKGAGNWLDTLVPVSRTDIIDTIFHGRSERTKSESDISMRVDIPLNLILYGPPGTGKTYQLNEVLSKKFIKLGVTRTREAYLQEIVAGLPWWQVIALVLLDFDKARVPNINDHELLRAKDEIMNLKNCRNMIWAMLQSHTVEDCPNVNYSRRSQPLLFSKDDDGAWSIDSTIAQNEVPELFDIKQRVDSPEKQVEVVKRYEFVTFSPILFV